MKNQIDLDLFLPTMDAPERVYQLFESLGFKVLDSHLKTNPSVYNLPVKEAALVEKIYAVSNYDRRFQILLFKLQSDCPEQSRREAIRTIPEKILREVDFPFIIFTPDFKTYTFTLVEKVREGPGEFKRKLTKLVVDSNQPYHTDKEILRSLALSADTKNPVEVYKLFQNAFNVERVTKKFFTEYRDVFEKLSKEITKQNKHLKFTLFSREGSVENFTKILLGRLMFLYFIQKRGWLNCFDGWGSGDKKFLYNKFQEGKREKKNYFKDYLEPLFFDTLNNPRRDKPDQATDFGGRIPFLNGGLFEPNYEYKDPSQIILLNNDSFEFVFSVFEKYNFTVKEDEPLEKEVAIDPEMLGKVFENLLEENLRKGKGTYYTPREIVHYMCHESLINYLASEINIDQDVVRNFLDREQSLEKKETLSSVVREKAKEIDDSLENIKVLDPACGSGAFLVGMLHEVVNARLSLNRELGRSLSEYELKKATIQNNIYGVDIDPGATEIAKLRLWLTLVVDHNLSEIEPLPNLDYKIMVGNSLIEEVTVNGKSIRLFNYEFFREKQGKKMKNLFDEESQADLFDNLHWQNIQTEVEQIIKKKKLLFNTFEFEEKQKLRREINDLENELIRKSLRHEAQLLKDKIQYERQKSELKTDKQNKELLDIQFSKSFLDDLINDDEKLNEYKSSNLFLWKLRFIEVFDKKEGFDVVIANPPYIRQEKIKDQKVAFRNQGYRTFDSVADLYVYFYERAYQLLNDDGVGCYISSNKFMRARYGTNLRNFLKHNAEIKTLIDFNGHKVFDASVDTCILIFTKMHNEANKIFVVNVAPDMQRAQDVAFYFNRIGFTVPQVALQEKSWLLADSKIYALKEKIEKQGTPLKNWGAKTFRGVVTGLNEAFILNEEKRTLLVKKDSKCSEIIKPLVKGKDLAKYRQKYANRYLLLTKNGINVEKEYPSVYQYLLTFKDQLVKRWDKGNYWFNLRDCVYYNEFEKPKILYPDIKNNLTFSLDNQGHYCDNTAYFINSNNMFLLGVLNSSLMNLYYTFISSQLGSKAVRHFSIYIEQLPVIKADQKNQEEITGIVEKIIAITKGISYSTNSIKQAEVKQYEKQIDQLVYKLYGLRSEEIAVVEGKNE